MGQGASVVHQSLLVHSSVCLNHSEHSRHTVRQTKLQPLQSDQAKAGCRKDCQELEFQRRHEEAGT